MNFPLNNLDLSQCRFVFLLVSVFLDYFGEYDPDMSLKYNLIGNICHEGRKPEGGVYKIHVRHKSL